MLSTFRREPENAVAVRFSESKNLAPRRFRAMDDEVLPMARELKQAEARRHLTDQVTTAGEQIARHYGPHLGWEQLQRLLADRRFVRYPCELRFEAEPLLPGEFAHPVQKGQAPEEGYILYVHPHYASQLPSVPYLVMPQLALINFGAHATAEDAETFGALALGVSKEAYYQALCDLSNQISGHELI